MTSEEIKAKFPIGTRVRIKSQEEVNKCLFASYNHILHAGKHYGQYGEVTKVNGEMVCSKIGGGSIPQFTISVKRDNATDSDGTCWYYQDWLEIADEDYAAIFKRKRDENLRSMFC